MNKKITDAIRELCPADIYEIGYASLKGLLHRDYSDYAYGISLARKLDDPIINAITNGPTIEYFNLYHSINHELNEKVMKISDIISSYGIMAYPVQATLSESEIDDSYSRTMRSKISHKMTATRAGLGWIGKTDLLITKRFGPRVRLATVLLSESVSEPGVPIEESLCGSCDLCVRKCPASASTGLLWSKNIDRDDFYNPGKCRDYCKSISDRLIQKDISICGICVSVCPKGISNL